MSAPDLHLKALPPAEQAPSGVYVRPVVDSLQMPWRVYRIRDRPSLTYGACRSQIPTAAARRRPTARCGTLVRERQDEATLGKRAASPDMGGDRTECGCSFSPQRSTHVPRSSELIRASLILRFVHRATSRMRFRAPGCVAGSAVLILAKHASIPVIRLQQHVTSKGCHLMARPREGGRVAQEMGIDIDVDAVSHAAVGCSCLRATMQGPQETRDTESPECPW